MPNDYSRGKIYKIVCRKTGLQYFGSTTEPTLARRLASHVGTLNQWKKGNFNFVSSFTILEENDYYIELVELVPCSSNDELKIRERFHIQNNECVNKYIPLRMKKYYEEHKEQILEKAKEYNEEHKEEIVEYRKKRYNEHKEELIEKQQIYYDKHKEERIEYANKYRIEHKEQIVEKRKKDYQLNKEIIKELHSKKIDCPCGGKYTFGNTTNHKKTIMHQNYLKKQLQNAETI
jgi:vacuolar-type H+-ATPase subunit I/STV1